MDSEESFSDAWASSKLLYSFLILPILMIPSNANTKQRTKVNEVNKERFLREIIKLISKIGMLTKKRDIGEEKRDVVN